MKRLASALFALAVVASFLAAAPAQSQVSGLNWRGPVTAGHCTMWYKAGVLEDAGVSGCGSGGSALPTCTLNQLIYYATSGSVGSCLTLGTNLSITGGTLNASGGGGSPGGSNGQIQYNNSGAFGGISTTGSGNVVLSTSPVITLPNATGLPVSGLSGLGAGVATWLGAPTLANLNTALGVSLPTLSATQTFSGNNTFSGTLTASTLVLPSSNVFEMYTNGEAADIFDYNASQLNALTFSVPVHITSYVYLTSIASGGQIACLGLSSSNELTGLAGTCGTLSQANSWTATNTFAGIVDSGISAGTSPICPNGTGGALTTTGCASAITLQTNGTNNASQTALNIESGQGINCSNPSSGNVQCVSNYSVRQVTTNTDTITSSDCAYGVYYSYAGTVSVTIPSPTGSYCGVDISASPSTTVILTPSSGTINSNSTLSVGPSLWSQIVDAASGNWLGYGTAVSFNAGVTYLIDEGTKFTIGSGTGACATASVVHAGSAVGTFECTGSSGASTIVVNLPTAVNGWYCGIGNDLTTTSDSMHVTATSTTTVTYSGTLVADDVVQIGCLGY